jgi:hypothetical protein
MQNLEDELQIRLGQIELAANQGEGLDRAAWTWLIGGCLIVPILLLIWGW